MNQSGSYVTLQQVEHALLCDLFALVELLQRLLDLVVLDLPLPLLLVVEVQTAALHLLQMMLHRGRNRFREGPALIMTLSYMLRCSRT